MEDKGCSQVDAGVARVHSFWLGADSYFWAERVPFRIIVHIGKDLPYEGCRSIDGDGGMSGKNDRLSWHYDCSQARRWWPWR